MKFTRKTDYALRTLQNLARRHYNARSEGVAPKPVPVVTIAKDKQSEVIFNNVQVPPSRMVGEVNAGAAIARALASATNHSAASMLLV